MVNIAAHSVQCVQPVALCVDDDPSVLSLVQRLLQKNGYSVLTAVSGDEAMEVFLNNRIDIVVLDYDMPGMKGHELTAQVKGLNPKVPVIMQSGTPNLSEEITKAADVFLMKGFDLKPLLTAISMLIESHGHQSNRDGTALNIVLPA